MYSKYENFLNELDIKLEKMFAAQKSYVFCKPGCDRCCSLGEYPLSRFEFEYLLEGYKSLEEPTKSLVTAQINDVKTAYKAQKNKNLPFEHACPFLVSGEQGGVCSVYGKRPLICRTFGLIKAVKTADGFPVMILPDCIHANLNYSNVFDFENNCFDLKKIEAQNSQQEPEGYDIGLPVLHEQAQRAGIDFKDRKNLAEFLSETEL